MTAGWIERQIALNEKTAEGWECFAAHRARVTSLLGRETGHRLGILGAGNGNDVDLKALGERFEEIHLVDLDATAIAKAKTRSGLEAPRLVSHGGVDLSGLSEWLAESPAREPTPASVEAAVSRAGRAELPFGDANVVASTCLLSQLVSSVVERLGARHPRVVDLVRALRGGHVATMAKALKPGGRGVLVTDVVSSDTAPDILTTKVDELGALLKSLLVQGNFFTGANPFAIAQELAGRGAPGQPLKAVELHGPWLWSLSASRGYLVTAVSFRKPGGRRVR